MKVLITGGTGSIGKAFTKHLLENGHAVGVFSRDDFKQDQMKREFPGQKITFFLGDIRDTRSLRAAFHVYEPELVIHLAAIKQIPAQEIDPLWSIDTNIHGTKNVLDMMEDFRVPGIFASSSNVVDPASVYGLTKALGEKLWTCDLYSTQRVAVRFGTLLSSHGSVALLFKELGKQGKSLSLTDPEMTRFLMTTWESTGLLHEAMKEILAMISNDFCGGVVLVWKCGAYNLGQLADIYSKEYNVQVKVTGARQGDKKHITLVSSDEVQKTENNGPFHMRIGHEKVNNPIPGPWISNEHVLSSEKLRDYLIEEYLLG